MSEESRSEGKVGLKAYKNYLIAGAHWLAIVFLILLNIIAQVNKGIYFVLWPQLDVYSTAFPLCIYYYRILRSTWICIETCYLGGQRN